MSIGIIAVLASIVFVLVVGIVSFRKMKAEIRDDIERMGFTW